MFEECRPRRDADESCGFAVALIIAKVLRCDGSGSFMRAYRSNRSVESVRTEAR